MPKNNTSWGNVAGWYDDLLSEDADSYQKKVILPNILRLLAPARGDKILDLACGSGFFSFELARAGAEVLGVDISPELIELAKKRVATETRTGGETYAKNASSRAGENMCVTFVVSSAENFNSKNFSLTNLAKKESFNKAVIILSIQNIENVKKTLENCFVALAPGGKLFIVMNHPAFRIPKATAWVWDEKEKKQYRRVGAYLSESKEKIDMAPGTARKNFTISFHRPLQYYFKIFQSTGFSITRLEEWISHKKSAPGPRQKEEDRARKEIPIFLFIELKKT